MFKVKGTKYSTGNSVDDIVIAMGGAKWVLEIPGGTLSKLYDCLTTVPYTETNICKIILNVNCN